MTSITLTNPTSLAEKDNNELLTAQEKRAQDLLGNGISQEIVASAVGLSPSRISQLMAIPTFSSKVSELRYLNLTKHSAIDADYDSLEQTLLGRMKGMVGMMFKPGEVLRALQVINAAKRRGPQGLAETSQIANVVNITLPTIVHQQFTTNINNQVVKVGTQDLTTIQSVNMKDLLKEKGMLNEQPTILLASSAVENPR